MQPSASDEVLIRREGRAGRITMNRPKALNALTYPMVGAIWMALLEWRDDPAVELVLLDGTGERGLCAGGDVRSLYDSRTQGSGLAREFWRDEYRLNACIGRYPKPYVAIQDGIVMGGGIGLSSHGSHRVVTERSQLAMPETGIGLIPDVGGTWLLANAPGETGVYLGLTGEAMRAADAVYARFSDALVPSAKLPALIERLSDPHGGTVGEAIRSFADDPGEVGAGAPARRDRRGVCGREVERIHMALAEIADAWASKTRAALGQKSPKALKLTLAAIRQARRLPSLEEALKVEYRLTVRLFEDGEFPEGVRALLDRQGPQAQVVAAALGEVTDELVARYLAPLPPGEELTF